MESYVVKNIFFIEYFVINIFINIIKYNLDKFPSCEKEKYKIKNYD